MKTITGLSMILSLFTACNNTSTEKSVTAGKDTSFVIKGTINISKGLAILNYIENKNVRADTSAISNGSFSFAGKFQQAQEVGISFTNESYNAGISFFAENTTIIVNADTASLNKPLVEGAVSQKDFEDFTKQVAPVNDKFQKLNKAGHDIFELGKLTKPVSDSLSALGRIFQMEKDSIIGLFVKTHPASVVSAWAIGKNMLYEPNVTVLEPLFDLLSAKNQTGIYGDIIHEAIVSAKATAIGSKALSFTQSDTSGKKMSLDSLKGKYTFVDFWASWCGPCRAENPNVVKAYHQYKTKGFAIVGVSLDTDKDAWIRAIKKDKLAWTELSDLQGWKSETTIAYGIKGIPFNVLLDKNGTIIAKNLRGAGLQDKLKAIFK